ncbi:MAG: pyruvate kinase [Candidatus Sericytochromatia bacterium]|nr:MAG: pyruvate kinase [Candidatus Sericytochromatia bacterium]
MLESIKNSRRTKIVATIGPACSSKEMITELIKAGVNVFRLNFSHGSHEEHGNIIKIIREASKELNSVVSILQDIQGPKIRIGKVENDSVEIKEGQDFYLTNKPLIANSEIASVTYDNLLLDIKAGVTILIDDGKIELKVLEVLDDKLHCKVITGGIIRPNKGVNFPKTTLSISSITEKDKKDIIFGIKNRVDFIAVSFVQKPSDVMEVKEIISSYNSKIPIVSKIECQAAIDNLEDILAVSDAIMVARGDMGVELDTEDIPLLQKKIIKMCNKVSIPVITATQMLDSMINNPRPTRAETTDIANAILDGTDAIMLSNETAVGKYPIETVKTMAKIAQKADMELIKNFSLNYTAHQLYTISGSISMASTYISQALKASAIITATFSGSSAKKISRFRPPAIIIAATPELSTLRQMTLVWGVYPILIPPANDTDSMIKNVVDVSKEQKLITDGDIVVITTGVPIGVAGTTNIIKVEVVTTIIAQGMGVGKAIASGKVVFANTPEEAINKINQGDILVTTMTDRDFVPAMKKSGGVITEEGGLTSHAAIVCMSLGIPLVIGVSGVFEKLKEGSIVTIDPRRGLIFAGNPQIV